MEVDDDDESEAIMVAADVTIPLVKRKNDNITIVERRRRKEIRDDMMLYGIPYRCYHLRGILKEQMVLIFFKKNDLGIRDVIILK